MKKCLFGIAQVTWGLPQTLLGALVFLIVLQHPHFMFHGAIATVWPLKSSVSLGLFIFVAKDPRTPRPDVFAEARTSTAGADPRLIVHEYGHCIQSLIFGPLYLLVIGIPSFLWAQLPAMRKRRARTHKSYYSLYTERLANYLGECVTKMPSLH